MKNEMKSKNMWIVNGCPCYTPPSFSHHTTTKFSLLLLLSPASVIASESRMATLQSLAFTSPLSHCCKQSPPLSGTLLFFFFSSAFFLSTHLRLSMFYFIIHPFTPGFDSCLAVDAVSCLYSLNLRCLVALIEHTLYEMNRAFFFKK